MADYCVPEGWPIPPGWPELPKYNPDQPERAVKGIWIPRLILMDENLTAHEKIFLADIWNLSPNTGEGCYASNEYLASFSGISPRRVANIISDLKQRGYIRILPSIGKVRRIAVDIPGLI